MAKVLVIRFSSIGDIVLTSPVVRCLKDQIPGVSIHYLVKKSFLDVVKAHPGIDRVIPFDGSLKTIMPEIRAGRYDHIIDLQGNLRSLRVRLLAGVPSSTFPKINARKWLAVRFKWNTLPGIHVVDRYFRAVSGLGVAYDGRGLDYYIPEGEEVAPDVLPASHRQGFLAVVAGAKHGTKIFPADRVAEVIRSAGIPAVLLGGPEDRDRGEEIAGSAGALAFNGCGRFTLGQSASLVRQSVAVLTNDTGLMHIAAAFRKPVVSVWGNTVPEFGMYPFYPAGQEPPSLQAEVKGLSCRPCSKLGYPVCPEKHFRCMRDIDIPSITVFLKEVSKDPWSRMV